MGTITIEEFRQVELKVGTITAAEAVPGATKLLRLQVDLGEAEPRQLVAGIAQQYKPEELPGKQIVVVANLQPATIRGIESQGMLLAAVYNDGNDLALLTVDKPVPNGARVE